LTSTNWREWMKITLEERWKADKIGVTFPIGTIFLWRGPGEDVWTYLCPDGSHGECWLQGQFPGD